MGIVFEMYPRLVNDYYMNINTYNINITIEELLNNMGVDNILSRK